MSELKVVPVETIMRAIDALELYASNTLAGTHSADELRMVLLDAPDVQGEVGEGVPDARWLLDQYEAFIAAIPVGQENRTRGASAYNWHRAAKATLESLLAAAPAVQEEPVGWVWHSYNQTNFTSGSHHKEVLEADGVKLTPVYTAPQPAEQQSTAGDSLTHVPDCVFAAEFAAWWEDHGQFCRAGGGTYEKSFAFEAWRHLYPQLMNLQMAAEEQQPAPDVSALVEALEASSHGLHQAVDGEGECRCGQCAFVRLRDSALAAHRKQPEGEA